MDRDFSLTTSHYIHFYISQDSMYAVFDMLFPKTHSFDLSLCNFIWDLIWGKGHLFVFCLHTGLHSGQTVGWDSLLLLLHK